MTRPRVLLTACLLGLAALATGAALTLSTRRASFGWFAYAPLSPLDEGQTVPFVTNAQLLSWAVAVSGLVVLAGCVGYVVGRRNATVPGQGPAARPDRPNP